MLVPGRVWRGRSRCWIHSSYFSSDGGREDVIRSAASCEPSSRGRKRLRRGLRHRTLETDGDQKHASDYRWNGRVHSNDSKYSLAAGRVVRKAVQVEVGGGPRSGCDYPPSQPTLPDWSYLMICFFFALKSWMTQFTAISKDKYY